MLEQNKKIYEEIADRIAGWKILSKNDLARGYIANENDPFKKDGYMAALVCKYWPSINRYYAMSKSSTTFDECYNWLTGALMYALKHRKWEDPSNALYTDKNGPDKVINRCMATERRIFYQAANTSNRKINFETTSIQDLEEDQEDYVLPSSKLGRPEDLIDNWSNLLIKEQIKNNNYAEAIVIDCIANEGCFVYDKKDNSSQFNMRRLVKCLKGLDNDYCKMFVKTYSADSVKTLNSADYFKSLSSVKIYKDLAKTFVNLKSHVKAYEPELCM